MASTQQASQMALEKRNFRLWKGRLQGYTRISLLEAAFKSIKTEAFVEKYPETYAAMADQINAFGYDDALETFNDSLDNMYPSGPDKREDFNEVCAQCDYCEAMLLAGWDWGELEMNGKTICRPCEKEGAYCDDISDEGEDEDDEDE